MEEEKQGNSGADSAKVNPHVNDARAAARAKNLDGFVHIGCRQAQEHRECYPVDALLIFHAKQPAQEETQGSKLREMPQFTNQVAGQSLQEGKGFLQPGQQSAADFARLRPREQGVAPDETGYENGN